MYALTSQVRVDDSLVHLTGNQGPSTCWWKGHARGSNIEHLYILWHRGLIIVRKSEVAQIKSCLCSVKKITLIWMRKGQELQRDCSDFIITPLKYSQKKKAKVHTQSSVFPQQGKNAESYLWVLHVVFLGNQSMSTHTKSSDWELECIMLV